MMRDQPGDQLPVDSKAIITAVPQQSSQLKYYDVVIVGAGIAGLTAAVEATRIGKKVLIVEKRSESFTAIRPQLIYLYPHLADYLHKLSHESSDDQFIADMREKTRKGSDHYSIKHIQRFLMQHINNDRCDFHYESQVSAINFAEDYLVVASAHDLSHHEKIKFGDLILADGIKHGTANLLQDQLSFSEGYVAQRQEKKHVMGYFIVDAKFPDKKSEFPMQIPIDIVLYDGRVGFVYYDNFSLKKHNFKKVKLCVVMNLKDEQYEAIQADDQLGSRFLKHCVENVFSPTDWDIRATKSKKSGVEKDKLKYAMFQLDLFGAKQAAFESNGHVVALVGDARRGPDFYQGHGGNDAITDGQKVGCLISRTMSLSDYNKYCEESSDRVSNQTRQSTPLAERLPLLVCDYKVIATFPEFANKVEGLPRPGINQFQFFYHATTPGDDALAKDNNQADKEKTSDETPIMPQRRTFQSE